MRQISPRQVKAARALLDWKQENLAFKTSLSLTSIRSFENGNSPRLSTVGIIRKALEDNGVQFMEDDGVKFCPVDIKIYRDLDGCDAFLAHVLESAKETPDNVYVAVSDSRLLTLILGLDQRTGLERIEALQRLTNVRYIISETQNALPYLSAYQMRFVPAMLMETSSYVIYGRSYAVIVPHSSQHDCVITAYNIIRAANSYREKFEYLWERGIPPKEQAFDTDVIPVTEIKQKGRTIYS